MPILRAEIARTPLEHMTGLMGRKSLPKNSGMLFDFGYSKPLTFWMANTYIPLQIAFIDENGRVGQIERMSPMSTKPVRSKASYRYALEVNDGWFDENNVVVNSIIDLPETCLRKEAINIVDPIKKLWDKINPLKWKKKDEAVEPTNSTPPQDPPLDPNPLPGSPSQLKPPGQMEQKPQPSPKVVIEQSFRDILKAVINNPGTKVVVEYITKKGYPLPHRVIVPPMKIGPDAMGHSDNLITVWSVADAQYRSFLIDGPDGNGIQAIYDLQGNPIKNADQILEQSKNTPLSQEEIWKIKGIMTPDTEEMKQMEYQRLLTHKT